LGADYIVLGSYVDLGPGKDAEVRVDLRLQDAATGETVGLISETGKEGELFDLVTKAGSSLREKLGIGPMSPTQTKEVRSLVPDNPDASRLYAEGLSDLRTFSPVTARDLLVKAVSEVPNFALAHSALADAWSALGYDAKAAEEAKKALDAATDLDREQHLVVEGHYYETDRQWPKAIEAYHALWVFAPDNPDYGLRLAQSQSGAGQPKEALKTVDTLRKLPAPLSDDPRIDLAEEVAARGLSDFKRALAASLNAKQKGKSLGSQFLVARAEMAESRSYYSLGDVDHAREAAEEAKRLFASAGDLSGEAAALHNLATVLSDKGDNAGARQMDEQALTTCRNVGNQRCVADALNSIGVILKDQADFAGAQSEYRQSLAIRRELGDRSGEAVSLNNIAVVFYEQGQLANARKMYEQALTIARDIGEKRGIARALTNVGIVLQDEGQLSRAEQVCEQSITIRRQIADRQGLAVALNNYAVLMLEKGDLPAAEKAIEEQLSINQQAGNQRGLGYALFVKGNILEAEGKLEDARKAYEQALAIRDKIGEKTTAEESRVSLAKLSIEEGHSDVEASLREILAQAHKQKEPEIETFAEITLAESLLKLGRPSDAAKEIASAETAAINTEGRLHRVDVFIAAARVHAALREWSKASNILTSAISESNQIGCGRCELEARLALAELNVQRRNKNTRAMIASLSKDASKRGFLLVARKASALSVPH
jgi:tetratricopeptide (TPR) repeat protein